MLKLNYPFGIYQFFASFLQTKRKCSKRNDFLESGFLSRVEGSRPDVKRDVTFIWLPWDTAFVHCSNFAAYAVFFSRLKLKHLNHCSQQQLL